MGHEGNKLAAAWLTAEQFEQLEEFLDKFSTGGSFSERFRQFLVWTANQKQGIDTAALALRLEEDRKKRELARYERRV